MAPDCEGVFTTKETEKFLPETSIALMDKIKQEREVDQALLEDLEKCP